MKEIDPSRWFIYSSPKTGLKIPVQFKFTVEEKKTLENILRSFDKDKVQNFIFFLSSFGYIPLFVEFRGRVAAAKKQNYPIRDIEKDILPDLKQCVVTLRRIMKHFIPDPQRNFPSLRDPRIARGESPRVICRENAWKALPHVQTIVKTLEEVLAESKRGRRRPQADQDGFVYEVAKLYETIFHQEASEAKGGIFCKLINNLFGIVFPKEDGKVYDKSKTVERALDKLHAG